MGPAKLNRLGVAIAALSSTLMFSGVAPVVAADHEHHHHQPNAAANDQWEEAAVEVPDLTVVDQNGEKKRFFSDLVKGRTVAINFIYTSCTSVCSPLTATLRQVQKELAARSGDKVQLISVSVDPIVDTPAVLKDFASRFEAGPGWNFVTGKPADIERLLKAFGVPIVKKEDHTPLIFVTNEPTGKWTRAYGLATAKSIVETIAEAAGLDKVAERPQVPEQNHEHEHNSQHDHHS